MPIDSVRSLHSHLQLAINVELTTIPLYLYTMYSLADPAEETPQLIRSVAAEEMLHATIVGNLMVATGGRPCFYDPTTIPTFPCELPHHTPTLPLSLTRYSPAVVQDVFLVVEAPAEVDAPPEADEYETLGQFYRAVELALCELDEDGTLFAQPNLDRQVGDPEFYQAVKYDSLGSGSLYEITSCERALEALEIIVHQGEGLGHDRYADPAHAELTHYARFLDICQGKCEVGEVLPVPDNPRADNYPAPAAEVAHFFNALYCYSFVLMDRLFQPQSHKDRSALISTLYGTMVALMRPVATYLTTLEIGGGLVAAPTFEYHSFPDPKNAERDLRRMGESLAQGHPELAPVLHQLPRLP